METRSPLAAEIYAKQQAGYPVLAIETYEEGRVSKAVAEAFPNRQVYTYSATSELVDGVSGKVVNPQCKWADAFKFAATERPARRSDGSGGRGPVLIMFDYQHVVAGPAGYRPLLQYLEAAKDHRALFVLVAPSWAKLPEELKHAVPVIQLPLPSEAELGVRLEAIETAYQANVKDFALASEVRSAQLRAGRGMTLEEFENSLALSALNGWDAGIVEREKMRLVKSPCMNVETPADPSTLGGLGRFKRFIIEEVLPSQFDEQLRVKGILLCGLEGVGKTQASRILAAMLKVPLIGWDFGAVKGSMYGQSEAMLRSVLSLAAAVAPVVIRMDEIEKALGGFSSSHNVDGGTTAGLVGTLLTFMQENTAPILFVGTCNDYSKLPRPMLRPGRFDRRFFIDVPTASERAEIAKIHLRRFRCDESLASLVSEVTNGFTGAEIEDVIKTSARRSGRQLTESLLEAVAKETNPVSKSPEVNLDELRQWATKTGLRWANDEEAAAPAPTGRKLEVTSDPEHAFPAFQPKGGQFAN